MPCMVCVGMYVEQCYVGSGQYIQNMSIDNGKNASHCSYAALQHSAQPALYLSTVDLFAHPIS